MKVGLVWRAEWDPPRPKCDLLSEARLRGVFAAFSELGVEPEPVVYSDETAEDARAHLLTLDGALVWVNPIEKGRTRATLDSMLRQVAERGVWVSAHPDVIARMATKRVLFDTRELAWGTDTRLYRSPGELQDNLPQRLADTPRVLKQQRGMGGQGVWKVELDEPGDDPWVRAEHADGSDGAERMRLSTFITRCTPYFVEGGLMVEQPFQPRIAEGMIRAYLTHGEVVGFAHQYPKGLRPADAGEPPPGKRFLEPETPHYQPLRDRLEAEWVPQMQRLLQVETHSLPVIWDADFLYGPTSAQGTDTYVLCEINASSTFAFPEFAMPAVARAAIERIREHKAAAYDSLE